MNRKNLPEGWRWVNLGDLGETRMGGTPKTNVSKYWDREEVIWITPEDMQEGYVNFIFQSRRMISLVGLEESSTKLLPPDSVILSTTASIGKVGIAQVPLATNQQLTGIVTNHLVNPIFLAYYLLHLRNDGLANLGGTTTATHINQGSLRKLTIPLPPLPVQERIVQILQKADEIRQKRKQALELVEVIARALFVSMFGEPGSNSQRWPTGPLNDLLSPEIERVNPRAAFPDEEFTYIEIAGIRDFRIVDVKRLKGADAPSRARQVVRGGDVLYSMTRPNLRKIAVVPEELDGAICTTGFAVLRPRNPQDSAFIFEIVKSDYFTDSMSRLAEAKSLYPAVDEAQVRQFTVIQPPGPARAHFGAVMDRLSGITSLSRAYSEISDAVFSSLLTRAFTGELTAEWEAANTDLIAEQQALHERLPRLLLLALLAEKAKRGGQSAATVLVTALMKYVFLLQMEGGAARRRLYHFVPYHYGPFAKELYSDLDKLQDEGLVRIEKDAPEDKTKITLADPVRIDEAIAALPDEIKQDVATIIETYGDLDHNALLNAVYEKYPTYARKSRQKQKGRTSK
ncbi:MAG: restriction endonuclease subunit S [Bacillota bacterium]